MGVGKISGKKPDKLYVNFNTTIYVLALSKTSAHRLLSLRGYTETHIMMGDSNSLLQIPETQLPDKYEGGYRSEREPWFILHPVVKTGSLL